MYALEILGNVLLSKTPCPGKTTHLLKALDNDKDVTLRQLRGLFASYSLNCWGRGDQEAQLIHNWLINDCEGLVELGIYDLLKLEGMPDV